MASHNQLGYIAKRGAFTIWSGTPWGFDECGIWKSAYAIKICFWGLVCDNKFLCSFYLFNGGCFINFHYVWFMYKLDIWFVYQGIILPHEANKTFFSSFRMPSTKLWLTIAYGFLTLPFKYLEIEIVWPYH